jgi:hypothetical protein
MSEDPGPATLHDVIRWLVRGGYPNTEGNLRRALLAIDAHEKGYPGAAAYQAELDKQAQDARERADSLVGETAEERAARAEARAAQLEAQIAASRGPSAAPPSTPSTAPES